MTSRDKKLVSLHTVGDLIRFLGSRVCDRRGWARTTCANWSRENHLPGGHHVAALAELARAHKGKVLKINPAIFGVTKGDLQALLAMPIESIGNARELKREEPQRKRRVSSPSIAKGEASTPGSTGLGASSRLSSGKIKAPKAPRAPAAIVRLQDRMATNKGARKNERGEPAPRMLKAAALSARSDAVRKEKLDAMAWIDRFSKKKRAA